MDPIDKISKLITEDPDILEAWTPEGWVDEPGSEWAGSGPAMTDPAAQGLEIEKFEHSARIPWSKIFRKAQELAEIEGHDLIEMEDHQFDEYIDRAMEIISNDQDIV